MRNRSLNSAKIIQYRIGATLLFFTLDLFFSSIFDLKLKKKEKWQKRSHYAWRRCWQLKLITTTRWWSVGLVDQINGNFGASFLGSGPEGADDLCFHTGRNFLLLLLLLLLLFLLLCPPPLASKLKSQPQAQITVSSLNPRLRAQIPTLWLKSQLHRSYSNLLAQIPALKLKSQPWGSNLSLQAKIPASRLKSQPWGSNPSLKAQIPALKLKS